MKLAETANGVYAIAPTPFDEGGRVDFDSIDRLIDYYEKVGVDGLTILGILGEAQKLEQAEAFAVMRHFLGRTRLPIIVGVSAAGFSPMQSLAREAMEAGAVGVMIGSPPNLRSDDQIKGYFKQAAAAIGAEIPWCLQDYPLALGVQIPSSVIRAIIDEIPSCVMLKHEDWPGLEKITALRTWETEGMRRVSILCGNGGLFLDFELDRGVDGAMTGYAFPEMLTEIVRLSRQGYKDAAHDLFDAHLPLLRYEHQQGVGLSVRKYLFQKRGIFQSAAQRAPGAVLSGLARAEVDYLVDRVARRDPRILS